MWWVGIRIIWPAIHPSDSFDRSRLKPDYSRRRGGTNAKILNSSMTQLLFRLDGKVALVTGGYGGIGEAVCHALRAAGAKIAVSGHNAEKAQACAEALRSEGIDAHS